ncbi:MAG: GTP 3',8-cyclase MoaA [Chloroflexota bacterium]
MSTTPVKDQFNRPLRDLRISVTDRCNFRCTYCMPAEIFGEHYAFLKKDQILSFEEITRLVNIIVRLGAVKLRLTGGEPLVRRELHTLVGQLDDIAGVEDIAMTTNAKLMTPEIAQRLKDAGLKRVTISLDSMDDAVFSKMNGNRSTVGDVLRGIEAAEAVGLGPIKINCVVQKGVNDHTIVDLAAFCKEKGYIPRFIEYMDVGTRNGWEMTHVVPAKEIIERINAKMPLIPAEKNYYGEVALRYRYADGEGEMGVIASVTQPFCGSCTRMRLSPEGQLYTCLFATNGTDLKTPLRDGATDDEIEQIIRNTWGHRIDRYSEDRKAGVPASGDKIEMYYIGG